MQNVGIAFIVIFLNFPSPECDYALLPLIAVVMLTTLPLWLLLIIKTVYKRVKAIIKYRKKSSLNETQQDAQMEGVEAEKIETETIETTEKLNLKNSKVTSQ
jgi:hypothetical protein